MKAPASAHQQVRAQRIRVLILEDSAIDAELLVRQLRRDGFEPEWERVETQADFIARLATAPDLVLSDYSLPTFDGLKAAQLLQERNLDIPYILVSGTLGEEVAVAAIKQGVSDYLLKGNLARLGAAVTRALEEKRLRAERRQLEKELILQATALKSAANGIMITDAQGTILSVNPAFTTLTGYSAEEAIGQKPGLLKSGEHDAEFYAELW